MAELMTDNDTQTRDAEAFWQFAGMLYARPAVAEACLLLQDRDGLDVNLVLLCLWAGSSRDIRLTPGDFARLEGAVACWNATVLTPLRTARRALREGPAPLYAAAKALELDAERHAQTLLIRALPTPRAPPPEGGASERAALNLGLYLPVAAALERHALLAAVGS
jgi:uncharacterized protein (TIGR02444 family)